MDTKIYESLAQVPRNTKLEDLEDWYIILTLERNNLNRTKTSEELGISLRKLRYKIKQLSDDGYPVKKMLPPRHTTPHIKKWTRCQNCGRVITRSDIEQANDIIIGYLKGISITSCNICTGAGILKEQPWD